MAASNSPTTEPADSGRFYNPEADSMKTLRLSWTALLLASLVPLLPAAPQSASGARAKKLDKQSQSKTADAKPELTEAQKDFRRLSIEVSKLRSAEFKKQREEMKKQQASGGSRTMGFRMRAPDLSSLTPKYVSCARKYQRTDDAIMFLTQILMISNDEQIQKGALEILWRNHYESDKLADFALAAPRLMRKLSKELRLLTNNKLATSPNLNVQGAWLYTQATTALRNPKIDAEAKAKAHEKLKKAIKIVPKASFVPSARGILFEASRLQIGMKAPDIEGKDTDGVAFKLSDYKGKVIMLDFWGDW